MDTVFRRLTVFVVLWTLAFSALACVKSPEFNPNTKYPNTGALCAAWRTSITHGIDTAVVSGVVPDTAGGCGAAILEYGGVVAYVSIDAVSVLCDPKACPSLLSQAASIGSREISGLSKAAAAAVSRDASRSAGAAFCTDGCTVTWPRAACGGIGDLWSCELSGATPTDQPCSGDGAGTVDPVTKLFTPKNYASGNACDPSLCTYGPLPNGGGPNTVFQLGYTCPAECGSTYSDVPASTPQPQGKCVGQVNGVTVSVNCDSSLNVVQGTKSTAVGSVTATTAGETATTCSGGSCTSVQTGTKTTSTLGPDGSVTSTSVPYSNTAVDLQGEYCNKNPNDIICKGSKFGGACSTSFTCEGDAAQCATAIATNKLNCSLGDALKVDVTNAAYIDGAAAMGAGDPSDHPAKNKSVFDITAFNQDNPFGATCPSDQTVSLGGGMGSLVIPLSSACSIFQMMGALLVGLTLLASAMFVIRGT